MSPRSGDAGHHHRQHGKSRSSSTRVVLVLFLALGCAVQVFQESLRGFLGFTAPALDPSEIEEAGIDPSYSRGAGAGVQSGGAGGVDGGASTGRESRRQRKARLASIKAGGGAGEAAGGDGAVSKGEGGGEGRGDGEEGADGNSTKRLVPKEGDPAALRRSKTFAQTGGGFCPQIHVRKIVNADGSITDVTLLPVAKASYLQRFNETMRYTHMVNLLIIPAHERRMPMLMAVFQGAPLAPKGVRSGYQRVGVEGLASQSIFFVLSPDMGNTWGDVQRVPTPNKGAVWSPVIHWDSVDKAVWLFYAESNECFRNQWPDTNYKRNAPGGDIKVIKFRPKSGRWVPGPTILTEASDKIPKVIANPLEVTREGGDWVLPFWKEVPSDGNCAPGGKGGAAPANNITWGVVAETVDDPTPAPADDGEDDDDDAKEAPPPPPQPAPVVEEDEGGPLETQAGVLISKDNGLTWTAHGSITELRTPLIEGSILELEPSWAQGLAPPPPAVEAAAAARRRLAGAGGVLGGTARPGEGLGRGGGGEGRREERRGRRLAAVHRPARAGSTHAAVSHGAGKLKRPPTRAEVLASVPDETTHENPRTERLALIFRTKIECAFKSFSYDHGDTWTAPEPTRIPNPNSKMHMIRLKPHNYLAIAFNNHGRGACSLLRCRTHIHVAISPDEGATWHLVAQVDDEIMMGIRAHYPMLLQISETRLLVAYTRFYIGDCSYESTTRCLALNSEDQGVKLVELDLSAMDDLPHIRALRIGNSRTERTVPLGTLHTIMADHVAIKMEKYRHYPWPDAASNMFKLRTVTESALMARMEDEYDLDFAGMRKSAKKLARKIHGFYKLEVLKATPEWVEKHMDVWAPGRLPGYSARASLTGNVTVVTKKRGAGAGAGAGGGAGAEDSKEVPEEDLPGWALDKVDVSKYRGADIDVDIDELVREYRREKAGSPRLSDTPMSLLEGRLMLVLLWGLWLAGTWAARNRPHAIAALPSYVRSVLSNS